MQVVENLDNKLTWKPIERVTRVRYYALDNVQAMFVLDDSAEQAGETGRGSALWKMHKILAGCITLHRARLVADRGRPESSCWPFRMTADVMLSTCSCQSAFVSWCECEEGINCSDGRRAALSHEVVQCAASVSCGRTGRTRTRKDEDKEGRKSRRASASNTVPSGWERDQRHHACVSSLMGLLQCIVMLGC
jgi:hypothetical protein